MTLKIFNYDIDPGSNNDEPPVGAPENNDPSTVNNIQRYQMSAMAEFADHVFPVNTTAGTAAAYTVNIGQSNLAPQEGYLYSLKFHVANTAAPTLAVNGQTAATIVALNGDALVAGDIEAGSYHILAYGGTNFRLLTLDEYHAIRRGNYTLQIEANNNLQFRSGSDIYMRVEPDGDAFFNGDLTAESTAISSDERDKRDLVHSDIASLYSVFSFIDPREYSRLNGRKDIGFSAQEVEKAEPRLTITHRNNPKKEERLALRNVGLLAVLWGAVKYLDKRIQKLEAK